MTIYSRLVPTGTTDQSMGTGTGRLATPETGGRLRPPPQQPAAASGPGRRRGSVVFEWRALRPPRVVFVRGFLCLLINSLTSGKKEHVPRKRNDAAMDEVRVNL